MEITPYYGNEPLSTSSVVIRVNPEDRKRAQQLLGEASEVVVVKDDETFAQAKYMAGRLKALLNEIETSRKSTKQPFDAVLEAISQTAAQVGNPVKDEQQRILGLLNEYVSLLEAERKAQERARLEEARRVQAEHDRRIREAQEAQARAEAQVREAQDEAARQKARAEAQAKALAAAQEQLAKEIALEGAQVGQEQAQKGLVTGGRVDHVYKFKLIDVTQVIQAGALRLLRFEIDHLACQDECKAQLDNNPDLDPELPGIQVTRSINVSVRARSR